MQPHDEQPHNATPAAKLSFRSSESSLCAALDQTTLMQELLYMVNQLQDALWLTASHNAILRSQSGSRIQTSHSEIIALCQRARSLMSIAHEL